MSNAYLTTTTASFSEQEDRTIREAIDVLENRLFQRGPTLTSPDTVKEFLKLSLGTHLNEVFAIIFLDVKHRVIAFEILFKGTVDSAKVCPRIVLQRSLAHNSAAVILAHNHPSGDVSPSQADRILTETLVDLLAKVDIRILDHIIVGSGAALSFKESGIL